MSKEVTMADCACARVEGGLGGCVVVFAAFMIQVLAFGTVLSVGMYNIEFLRHFGTSAAEVSLVGAICLGVFMGAGPLASVLMSRWDHRRVALLGAALTSIGLVCTSFAPSIPYMYIFFGIITGLGGCFTYVPSHVLSGLYFHKYRSLSTGIATAGSGIGNTIFPVIIYELTETYGWRGSMLLVAGLNLHLLVFAALLRPIPRHQEMSIEVMDQNKSGTHNSGDVDETRAIEMSSRGKNNMEIKQSFTVAIENDITPCGTGQAPEEGTDVITEEHTDEVIHHGTCVDHQHTGDTGNSLSHRDNGGKILSVSQRLTRHICSVFAFDFIIYFVSCIFWNAGSGIIVVFLPEYMITVGLDKQSASLAFMFFGGGTCLGCIAGGLLGVVKYINRISLYIRANIGAGAITLFFPWTLLHNFTGFSSMCFLFGFFFGIILGLIVVVTSDLLGTEKLGDGFGYLMVSNGVGTFAGPLIAGVLIDRLEEMDSSIYVAGGITIAAGLVMCLVPFCMRKDNTRTVSTTELVIEPLKYCLFPIPRLTH